MGDVLWVWCILLPPDFSALSTHPCLCLHLMNFRASNNQHHRVNNHRKQESVANRWLHSNALLNFHMTSAEICEEVKHYWALVVVRLLYVSRISCSFKLWQIQGAKIGSMGPVV